MLEVAVKTVLTSLTESYAPNSIDGFVLIEADAYYSWGSAIHLIKDNQQSPIACEWSGWGVGSEAFDQLNQFIQGFHDDLYDVEKLTPEQIEQSFMDLTIDSLCSLRDQGCFDIPPFSPGVLLGVQTHDMSPQDQILEISRRLNTNENHARLVEAAENY